jgi:hypothetical protein
MVAASNELGPDETDWPTDERRSAAQSVIPNAIATDFIANLRGRTSTIRVLPMVECLQ